MSHMRAFMEKKPLMSMLNHCQDYFYPRRSVSIPVLI